ncbi:MAG: hypothetical protein K9M49_00510 [Candidatus Marinimicrobia bacterium]|nr:hypothetical protein [Candidatus Neomarinimicrobiota bacterium]MCF7903609.1 hypothetical protein [Candidatus Neomarinimicrobiota bacterium]
MSTIDTHPILGQLKESDRRTKNVDQLQAAIAERRRILDRDGKVTTVISGLIGISALFFMKPLSFYIILTLLILGLPAVWRHLVKEAREFAMTDEEIQSILDSN